MAQAPAPDASAGSHPASVFDDHNAPPVQLIDECVHCGFCLPTCPTYALWREEMDSPRGRIYLMKLGTEGKVSMTDTFVSHFDRCLGCMACVTACPSGVKYDKLIEATRAQIERHYPRSLGERLHRRMIFALFPYRDRLRLTLRAVWLYQNLGLRYLARHSGLLNLLPAGLRSMEALLPEVSLSALGSRIPPRVAAQGSPRRRVGLLLGCVQSVFFSHVNAATARVLAAEGCEVVIPPEQGCCGALMIHAGWERQALDLARRLIDAFERADADTIAVNAAGCGSTLKDYGYLLRDDPSYAQRAKAFSAKCKDIRRLIDAFERADVDTIAVNAAGCGSTLKDYGYLLRDDPRYAQRAKAFSAKCKDISEVLGELEPRAPRHPLPLRVAYHDSCHLQHAQGVRAQPRKALKTIPQLEVLEIPDAALCCGSAGIYNMIQPGPAQELGDRKVQNCLSTGAEMVVSANPGCLLQISAGLKRAGHALPVLHMVELMDASIRGTPKEALLRDGAGHR